MAIHRVVSIEIGLAKTRVIETDFKKKNPKIYKIAAFDTPENTIEDAYVRDKKVFSDALRRELEAAEIKCRNFMFIMNSSKILSREVNLPKVKEALIPGIIEGQKDEYFPMDISEHKLAYTIIAEDVANNQYRAIVYAVPDTLIKNYFNLAEELDGKLVALDYAGNSVYKWIRREAEKNPVPFEMHLQMNVQNTLVMILENGVMTLQRNINYGTNNVVEAYREAAREEGLKNPEIYKRLKESKIVKDRFNEADAEASTGTLDKEWLKNAELKDNVTEALRPFIVNINRVIEYYSTRNKSARIPEIKFFGLGTELNGLNNLIANEIGLPVHTIKDLEDANFMRGLEDKVSNTADLMPCVGGAIETIHFLDVQFEAEKKQGSGEGLAVMLILSALLLAAGAAVIVLKYMDYDKAVQKRNQLAKDYDNKVYIEPIEAQYNSKTATLEEIVAVHEATYTRNEDFNKLIAALEEKFPSSAIAHSFSSDGTQFIMSVTVPDKPTAAQFIMQLRQVEYVLDVNVASISEEHDDITGEGQVNFTVSCVYTPGSISDGEEGQQ